MAEIQFQLTEYPDLCADLQSLVFPLNLQRAAEAGLKSLMGIDNVLLHGIHGNKYLYTILNESRTNSVTEHHIRDAIKAH